MGTKQPRYIFVHGINTRGTRYADPLVARLGLRAGQVYRISWGHALAPALDYWRDLYRAKAAPWWRPVRRYKQRVFDLAIESAMWVRAYEDDERRRRIDQSVIDAVTGWAQPDDAVVFVGHSLGSVILVSAIELMLDGGILAPERIRRIVVMGSPLHVWSTPRRMKARLVKLPCERIVNIYDRDDLIARPLAPLDRRITDVEINTGGVFSSHVGYWGSDQVARIVAGD